MPVTDVLRLQLSNTSLGPYNSFAFVSPDTYLRTQVQRLRYSWSRSEPLGPVNPAQLVADVWDPDGYMDPSNPSSPYYDIVRPDRGIELRVSKDGWIGSNTRLIRGYIDDAVPKFNADVRTTTITASDQMRVLALQDFHDDAEPFDQYELTGDRFVTALDALSVPVPSGLRGTIQDGIVMVPPATASGNVLAYLQELARTERGGVVWCNTAGQIEFYEHGNHLSKTEWSSSQVTFAEDGTGGTKFLNVETEMGIGKFRMTDRVTASGYTGKVFAYGTAATDFPASTRAQTGTLAYYNADSWSAARWWRDAWTYKRAYPTRLTVQVWPGNADALTAVADSRCTLLNRVTVVMTPPGHPAQRTYNCVIESVDHDITPDRWIMTLGLSSYDALPVAGNDYDWGATIGALDTAAN